MKYNTRDLKAGTYIHKIPELYELRTVVEHNPWHDNDGNVFNHTVNVVEQMELLLKKHVYTGSKIDLLWWSCVFHDIGKKETYVLDPKTKTNASPGHDIVGGHIAYGIMKRLQYSEKKSQYVRNVIFHHDVMHEMVTISLHRGSLSPFKLLKSMTGDIWKELVMVLYADMFSLNPTAAVRSEHEKRKRIVEQLVATV